MSHSHRVGGNAPNTRRRHLPDVARRDHGGFFDPTMPTDGLYGSQIDREFIDSTELGGEFVGPGNIQDEAVTPDTFDTTPPDAPTGISVGSDVFILPDGTSIVRLLLTLTHDTATDLLGVVVHVTKDYTVPDPAFPDAHDPDWTYPQEFFLGRENSQLIMAPVDGQTEYWVRVRSRDIQGNESSWATAVAHTTTGDFTAPDTPTAVTAVAGFRGAICKWAAVEATDLAVYEVSYYLDDGSGTAPNESTEATVRTRSNAVWITGLTPDQRYWFRVLSEDRSGNRSAQSADVLASTSCVPSQVGAEDIAANSVSTTHISTVGLDASVIKTGYLAVQTSNSDRIDGIRIFDTASVAADDLVARWDENGLIIYDPADTGNYVKITSGAIYLYKSGQSTPITAITPDGIDASAITFGKLPGGVNTVPNSSFEVGSYSVDTTAAHTTFTTGAAATNATYSAGSITITTLP